MSVAISTLWERGVWGTLGFLLPLAFAYTWKYATANESADEAGCEPLRVESGCGEENVCVAGTCRRLPLARRCGVGVKRGGCECAPGLESHLGACLEVDQLDLVPEECGAPSTWGLLQALQGRCAATSGDQAAKISSCGEDQWKRVSEQQPLIDVSMLDLPGVATVHFPDGEPATTSRWPSSSVRSVYHDGLMELAAELGKARVVLVIGRAHPDEADEVIPQERADFIGELLREILPTTSVRAWGAGGDVALSAARLRGNSAAQEGAAEIRRLAWDPAVSARIAELMSPSVDLQIVTSEDKAWIDAAAGRVAIVIPIYCEGTEFLPPPSLFEVERLGGDP